MREIKFRAWIPKGGLENKDYPKVGLMFFWDEFTGLGNSVGAHRGKMYETVMQYTGLKDKNGKEIWESDIVSVDYKKQPYFDNYVGQIDYDRGGFWCVRHNGYGGEGAYLPGLTDDKLTFRPELEVIGNIYESPQLLK